MLKLGREKNRAGIYSSLFTLDLFYVLLSTCYFLLATLGKDV